MSFQQGGNVNIFKMDFCFWWIMCLINMVVIDISLFYLLDGCQIVFEFDWGGLQQFYVMGGNGGVVNWIFFGLGCYLILVWLLCGDLIVFIK